MKQELTIDTLQELQARFGTFHDAVIHSVEFNIFDSKIGKDGRDERNINIVLGVKDINQQWFNLTFTIIQPTKYVLSKERRYSIGVVFNLNIDFFQDEVFLDFFPRNRKSVAPSDFEDNLDLNSVNFLVIGKKGYWHISEYQEFSDR